MQLYADLHKETDVIENVYWGTLILFSLYSWSIQRQISNIKNDIRKLEDLIIHLREEFITTSLK